MNNKKITKEYQSLISSNLNVNSSKDKFKDVTILEGITNPYPFLYQSDIGLLFSDPRGFSNSFLEYMMSSLCVISTKVGANKEFNWPEELSLLKMICI